MALLANLASPALGPHSWHVSHRPFCGDPARARLVREALSILTCVCSDAGEGGGCSESVATLGDAGHQLGGQAGGPWAPVAPQTLG